VREPFANDWQRLTGIRQLPPHHHHQAEPEEEEYHATKAVLDSDHLMVGGKNIFSPPSELVMLMSSVVLVRFVMRRDRSGSVHFRKKLRFNI